MSFFYSPSGVTFSDPDTNTSFYTRDYDLVYHTAVIPTATPKTESIDIPYRDGVIDLTEANGKEFIRYNSRQISITLVDLEYSDHFDVKFSKLKRDIHGKRLKIIFDFDPSYYYLGRIINFSDVERVSKSGRVVITAEVDPFKYSIHTNADNWLWDPFCFETDIIPNGANISVNGTTLLDFYTGDQTVIPTFKVTGTVTMTLRGKTFTLKDGKNYDIIFYAGSNPVTLRGSGTVTVDYERKYF